MASFQNGRPIFIEFSTSDQRPRQKPGKPKYIVRAALEENTYLFTMEQMKEHLAKCAEKAKKLEMGEISVD